MKKLGRPKSKKLPARCRTQARRYSKIDRATKKVSDALAGIAQILRGAN